MEISKEELIHDAETEENDMIVRRFVGMVGYDYIKHHKKNTPQIHPDFSENTRIFWEEIESRLKEPTVLNFDWQACVNQLEEQARQQTGLCQIADYSSSYHYGLKTAYWDAIKIIKENIKGEKI